MNAAPELKQRVRDFVAAHNLLADTGTLCAGFSGGADSTALVLLLRELAPGFVAIHLHHGLRGSDADRDAAWCRAFCAERGIPFEEHRLDVPAHRVSGESVEAAARRLRLEFWCGRVGTAGTVALGHHAADALEDMLMRLGRGANASGLTGLRPLRTVAGVRLIRPLLCLRRSEIEALLRAEGVTDWRDDRTNADTSSRRNAVRHEWLPLIRRTVGHDDGLHHSLKALRDDADFLEAAAAQVAGSAEAPETLRALHPALLPRVLRQWLGTQTGRDVVLSTAALERVQAAVAGDLERAVDIPVGGGLTLIVSRRGLRLRQPAVNLVPREWQWRLEPRLELPETGATLTAETVLRADAGDVADSGRSIECFHAGEMPEVLTVRSWRPGDRLVPFGANTPKKLQDVYTDARVPRERRSGVPVVIAGDRIIWVPGVCRAEFGRLPSGADTPVIRLVFSAE